MLQAPTNSGLQAYVNSGLQARGAGGALPPWLKAIATNRYAEYFNVAFSARAHGQLDEGESDYRGIMQNDAADLYEVSTSAFDFYNIVNLQQRVVSATLYTYSPLTGTTARINALRRKYPLDGTYGNVHLVATISTLQRASDHSDAEFRVWHGSDTGLPRDAFRDLTLLDSATIVLAPGEHAVIDTSVPADGILVVGLYTKVLVPSYTAGSQQSRLSSISGTVAATWS